MDADKVNNVEYNGDDSSSGDIDVEGDSGDEFRGSGRNIVMDSSIEEEQSPEDSESDSSEDIDVESHRPLTRTEKLEIADQCAMWTLRMKRDADMALKKIKLCEEKEQEESKSEEESEGEHKDVVQSSTSKEEDGWDKAQVKEPSAVIEADTLSHNQISKLTPQDWNKIKMALLNRERKSYGIKAERCKKEDGRDKAQVKEPSAVIEADTLSHNQISKLTPQDWNKIKMALLNRERKSYGINAERDKSQSSENESKGEHKEVAQSSTCKEDGRDKAQVKEPSAVIEADTLSHNQISKLTPQDWNKIKMALLNRERKTYGIKAERNKSQSSENESKGEHKEVAQSSTSKEEDDRDKAQVKEPSAVIEADTLSHNQISKLTPQDWNKIKMALLNRERKSYGINAERDKSQSSENESKGEHKEVAQSSTSKEEDGQDKAQVKEPSAVIEADTLSHNQISKLTPQDWNKIKMALLNRERKSYGIKAERDKSQSSENESKGEHKEVAQSSTSKEEDDRDKAQVKEPSAVIEADTLSHNQISKLTPQDWNKIKMALLNRERKSYGINAERSKEEDGQDKAQVKKPSAVIEADTLSHNQISKLTPQDWNKIKMALLNRERKSYGIKAERDKSQSSENESEGEHKDVAQSSTSKQEDDKARMKVSSEIIEPGELSHKLISEFTMNDWIKIKVAAQQGLCERNSYGVKAERDKSQSSENKSEGEHKDVVQSSTSKQEDDQDKTQVKEPSPVIEPGAVSHKSLTKFTTADWIKITRAAQNWVYNRQGYEAEVERDLFGDVWCMNLKGESSSEESEWVMKTEGENTEREGSGESGGGMYFEWEGVQKCYGQNNTGESSSDKNGNVREGGKHGDEEQGSKRSEESREGMHGEVEQGSESSEKSGEVEQGSKGSGESGRGIHDENEQGSKSSEESGGSMDGQAKFSSKEDKSTEEERGRKSFKESGKGIHDEDERGSKGSGEIRGSMEAKFTSNGGEKHGQAKFSDEDSTSNGEEKHGQAKFSSEESTSSGGEKHGQAKFSSEDSASSGGEKHGQATFSSEEDEEDLEPPRKKRRFEGEKHGQTKLSSEEDEDDDDDEPPTKIIIVKLEYDD